MKLHRLAMYKPRPIALTERELRVLRAIERALADEDPVLALVLRGPDAETHRLCNSGDLLPAVTS